MKRILGTAVALVALLAATLAVAPPSGATRAPGEGEGLGPGLMTVDDWLAVYPDLRGPSRIFLRYGPNAPRNCNDQGPEVDGRRAVLGSVSVDGQREAPLQLEQNIVEFGTVKAARRLVQQYRTFSKECVGNEQTDDGSGDDVLLKKRAWNPRRLGDESAGILVGWFQRFYVDWRRVLAVRVGRTVTVLEATFADVRPPSDSVIKAGRIALRRLAAAG